MSRKKKIGGSFAPPLGLADLDRYQGLADSCSDRRCREEMGELIAMVRKFAETGPSRLDGHPHPVGVGQVVPLEDDEIERIWDLVPYEDECDVIGRVFDRLPSGSHEEREADPVTGEVRVKVVVDDQAKFDLRNAAFHLLWYARELAKDREPITCDKVDEELRRMEQAATVA